MEKNNVKQIHSQKMELEKLTQNECLAAIKNVSELHKKLKDIQWNMPPQPEHFDHHIDLFHQWLETGNPLWLERGVFSSLALLGENVLELSCGDGFFGKNFYSIRSKNITACDFDPKAIETAKLKNSAPNITYVLIDIRKSMPEGLFENIIWDGAIEHFTLTEIDNILKNCKKRLTKNGIISGYTIVERPEGKSLSHHEYEFKDKEDLYKVFKPFFKNVTVFETIYPSRHNLYFWASDDVVPFCENWKYFLNSHQNGTRAVMLDQDINTFVEQIANHKNMDKNEIVNMLIRNNKALLDTLAQK